MKMLIISHTYITPLNQEKWQALLRLFPDAEVTLVTPQVWPTHLFNHVAERVIKQGKCTWIPLPTLFSGNEVRYAYRFADLAYLLSTIKPEVVHVEQGIAAFSYFQINLLIMLLGIKTKSCFFTWINWVSAVSLKYQVTWGLLERFNLYCSSQAIVGNHDAKMILQKRGYGKPIEVIPQLGVATQLYAPRSCSLSIRKTIGFVGRLEEEKGILLLLRVWFAINALFPDWDLVIIGDGSLSITVQQLVHTQNMVSNARVIVKGTLSHQQVAAMFHTLELFVLPSYDTSLWREQFGHVLIEAMAAEVPIVASDAGEIPFVVGDAGLIFKQQDEEHLKQVLMQALSDEHLRHTFKIKGYKRLAAHYTHEKIAEKTYNFWRTI